MEKANATDFSDANKALNDYEQQVAAGTISADTKISGLKVMDLIQSIRDEINNSETASCQNLGYYCGKNAVQNFALNYDPVGYVNYVIDLAIDVKAKWNGKGAKTKLDNSLTSDGLEGGVSSSSEVFGKSLNSSTYKKSVI